MGQAYPKRSDMNMRPDVRFVNRNEPSQTAFSGYSVRKRSGIAAVVIRPL